MKISPIFQYQFDYDAAWIRQDHVSKGTSKYVTVPPSEAQCLYDSMQSIEANKALTGEAVELMLHSLLRNSFYIWNESSL